MADAQRARGRFDLAARKAERQKRGAEAIVHARRNLELADEELARRRAELAVARERAEALHAEAGAEVQRLAAVRDHAGRRLDAEPQAAMSIETMNAIAEPVLAIAKEIAPLRLRRPMGQFTAEDVRGNDLVAFIMAIAGQLAALTGVTSAEHAAGVAAGREQAGAERDSRPRVAGDTVLAPGSRNVRGGIFAPGWTR